MHIMKRIFFVLTSCLFLMICASSTHAQTGTTWKIHDLNRPVPTVITPGTSSTPDSPGKAPSDAIILFDGKDLSQWLAEDNGPAKWKVENGYAEVVAKTGYIHTKKPFGDCQLHVEFYEPVPPKGESQERGNSGVFLMGLYEIQVLDSYQNKTYADGQAAAVYGQYPPLVNARVRRANGSLTTSSSTLRTSTRRANCLSRRALPSSRMVFSCKTTWKSRAGPPSGISPPTCLARTRPRWLSRTTAIPCATATSGFANCNLECGGLPPPLRS